ncbi:MFS transporter [Sphingobium chungbukense]|uniref:MFS transporter n=1 Tax=Sphingobium chungbukense TaxID=56193 RepID=UPI000ABF1392|nr:MFS transporter [Sphingobium chungbukense]
MDYTDLMDAALHKSDINRFISAQKIDKGGPVVRRPASFSAIPVSPPLLALSAITLLIQGSTLMSLGLFLPAMAADFGGRAGIAATAFLLAMSIMAAPVGWALDRLGVRPVLLGGIIFSAAGYAAASLAQERLWLAAAMAVAGAGVGSSTIVPGIAIITRRHPRRRGAALGVFLGAAVMAGAVVPPLIGGAIIHWGWRAAMQLCTLVIILACPALVLAVPSGRIARATETDERPLWLVLRSGNVRRIVGAMTLLQLAINGILFAAVDGLMAQGLSQPGAVAAYSIANLLGLPALLLGGILADRIGPQPALIGTAMLLAAGTAALLGVRIMGWGGVTAFVLLWGIASALPGQSGPMLLADSVHPNAFSRLLGINTAIISLVGALAPIWTDWMHLASGGYDLPVLIYAAMALAAAALVALIRPSETRADGQVKTAPPPADRPPNAGRQ